jgi:hypothetical protein
MREPGTVFVKPYVAYWSGSGRTRLVIHKLRHSGGLRLNAASFWTNEYGNPAGLGAACSETRLLSRGPLTNEQLSISNRFIVLCDVTSTRNAFASLVLFVLGTEVKNKIPQFSVSLISRESGSCHMIIALDSGDIVFCRWIRYCVLSYDYSVGFGRYCVLPYDYIALDSGDIVFCEIPLLLN